MATCAVLASKIG